MKNMRLRNIVLLLVFCIIFAGAVLLSSTLALSKHGRVIFYSIVAAAGVLAWLLLDERAGRENPARPANQPKLWVWRIVAVVLGALGIYLWMGNRAGLFALFPLDWILIAGGAAVYALLGTNKETKTFQMPSAKPAAFSNLFGREPPERTLTPATKVFIETMRRKSQDDPLLGAKLGAKEIVLMLQEGMKNDKGVHVESLLCILGSLAGFACQADLRAQAVARGLPETATLQTVTVSDGKHFFFGDALNDVLANVELSVWRLAAGAAKDAGCQVFPDLREIFQHVASTLGRDDFGVPRIPENHKATELPIEYLKLWLALFPTVKLYCPDPVHWPVLYGLAIQEVIKAGKDVIDPCLALTIAMECAVPMSKVDLPGELELNRVRDGKF